MHTVTISVHVNAMKTGEALMMIVVKNTVENVLVDVKPVLDLTQASVFHAQVQKKAAAHLILTVAVVAQKAGPDVVVINGQELAINSVSDALAQQNGTVSNALQTLLCLRAMADVSVYQAGPETAVSTKYTPAIHLALVTNAVLRMDKLVLMNVPAVTTDTTSAIPQADTVTHVRTTVRHAHPTLTPVSLNVHPVMMDSTLKMEPAFLAIHVVDLVTDHLATNVPAAMLVHFSSMTGTDIVHVTLDTWISAHVSAPIAVQLELLQMPTDIAQPALLTLLYPSTSLSQQNYQTLLKVL